MAELSSVLKAVYTEYEKMFLEDIASSFGFTGDERKVFLVRFPLSNDNKLNKDFAKDLDPYAKQENSVALFQGHLGRICKKLGVEPQPIGVEQKPGGRKTRDKIPWKLARKHLQENLFQPWWEERQPKTPLYVDRPHVERHAKEESVKPGALVRIKAPSKLGKTLLLNLLLRHAAVKGCRIVYLNLSVAEEECLRDLNQFLPWFCQATANDLGLQQSADECLQKQKPFNKLDCTNFFKNHLLVSERPLTLGLDGLDKIFRFPRIAVEFLGMLRSWHESGKTNSSWQKFRLIMAYSEQYEMALNQSPFNIGEEFKLRDFNSDEVVNLVEKFELGWEETQVKHLMDLIGGHPYLVQLSINYFKNTPGARVEELSVGDSTSQEIYGSHLQALGRQLNGKPGLADTFKQVITGKNLPPLEQDQLVRLHNLGFVQSQGGLPMARNKLYCQYFRERL